MTPMTAKLLVVYLVLALPAARALCDGAMPVPDTKQPTCHTPAPQPEGGGLPLAEADCCPACDVYVWGDASEEVPSAGILMGTADLTAAPLAPASTLRQRVEHPPDRSPPRYARDHTPLRL
jgi:hypothetical protein